MASYFKQKIKVFKKIRTDTWDSNGFEIPDFFDCSVKEGIGKIKDTFSFKILNSNDRLFSGKYSGDGTTKTFNLYYNPIPQEIYSDNSISSVLIDGQSVTNYTCDDTKITFSTAPPKGYNNIVVKFEVISIDDMIKIYKALDTQNLTDDNVCITGVVTNVPIDYSSNIVSVEGRSYIEAIFETLCPITTVTPTTPPEIIKSILNNISRWNKNRSVSWHPSNPSVKSDGSSFPTTTYVKNYTNAMDMIEELSSDKFTEDGDYLYWIEILNGERYLRWQPRPSYVAGTFSTLTQGLDVYEYKAEVTTDEIINAVIFICGKDCNNNPISDIVMNIDSITKYGTKFYFMSKYEKTTTDLMTREISSDTSKTLFDYDEYGKPKNWYPKSFPYTIQTWVNRETGGSITCNNKGEFNKALRDEAKYIVGLIAQKIVDKLGIPRKSATITIPYNTNYTKGSMRHLNLYSYNLYDEPLRIYEINYGEGTIDLSFKQDEQEAIK